MIGGCYLFQLFPLLFQFSSGQKNQIPVVFKIPELLAVPLKLILPLAFMEPELVRELTSKFPV